jgi:4-hydroxy-tetrahydrodipicolinate reductase
MKILVNGAGGHMGRILCGMIAEGKQGAALAGAADQFPAEGLLPSLADFRGEADCIIDFSNHAATKALTDYAVAAGLPLVIATTGQTPEELALIDAAAEKIPVFLAANMSLGIAVLARLVREAVRLFPDADIEIVEQHHNRKLDVPSGTALVLANAVKAARPAATFLIGRHENGRRTKDEVGIHSLRMGNTVGIHEVIINTGTQVLTLRHEAQDRALFAEGALCAAAFLIGKGPGLYGMEDMTGQSEK